MFSHNYVLLRTRLAASIALILLAGGSISSKPTASADRHNSINKPSGSTDTFDLSDFGAVGDGVADDGPALQTALDALAQTGGGTLFIPAGHYLIATPVAENFSNTGATITIQGVPSSTMPAPLTAGGSELAAGLDLTSDIIPATGDSGNAITLIGLQQLLIEHVGFTGRPDVSTDAVETLYLSDIISATIRHCEFYGLASIGGGNIVKAVRSTMTIELSVFLGCTANSGLYAPTVENREWRGFTVANSIFVDYGLRSFWGKTGLGSPLSWINMGDAASKTADSPRREFVVRDTFLDEGGWIGITGLPFRYGVVSAPIDLVYITGLRMNVSNFNTSGHLFYDAQNLMVESAHYGWSHNANSAIDINRVNNAIFDGLTCVDDASRLHADGQTQRLSVINSQYEQLDSQAQTTNVIQTATDDEDPVQFVRAQFVSALGRQPDPAAHFYWSDLLIKCGANSECLDQQRAAFSNYLQLNPQPNFDIIGSVSDENGGPLSGSIITLSGAQSITTVTDALGNFRISGLPTSGNYTITGSKVHYTFTAGQSLVHPAGNVNVNLQATLNRHSISGQITTVDGTPLSGIQLTIADGSGSSVTTDENGNYLFAAMPAGENYTVIPNSEKFVFNPSQTSYQNLSGNVSANFSGKPLPEIVTLEASDMALAFDSVTCVTEPFSIFSSPKFSADGLTRVMFFARHLEQINSISQIGVEAEDGDGNVYPLEIEYLGNVTGQVWLKQINVKLSTGLPTDQEVTIRLRVADGVSNKARIRLMSP
ncbi:MAG: carboxypeptidase regulatory-like domain-containing protein [Pyrinomonadaceae bacterium]